MAVEPPRSRHCPALQGVTLVRWGNSVACRYAARMLADFGARIIELRDALESPYLHVADAVFDRHLDTGGPEHGLDSRTPEGREALLAQLAQADALLEDHAPGLLESLGLDHASLASRLPGLVMISVTPYGQSGPYRDYRATDLELSYLSGLAHLTPRDISKEEGDGQPPLKMPASLVSIYAGISAAGAALTALRYRERGARGFHVDVSALESVIPTLRRELALVQYENVSASRFMRVWKLAPWGVKPCKDGYVFLQVVEEHHWKGLLDMMGHPEWAADPRYLDPDYRYQERETIERLMAPWLLQQTKAAMAWEAQRRAVPFAPVNTVADILKIPQLHFRDFFTLDEREGDCPRLGISHPLCYTLPAETEPWRTAPRPRSTAERDGLPLAGIRVLDFGHVWAGPYCTATLADMGADVVKVESRHRVDIHRRQGPYPDHTPGIDRSGVWNAQNRGKRSLTLNLSTPQGRELARELIAQSDVVVENFAPGVMARLGLDYASLCAEHPGLVMASLSAFGQRGPQRQYVGYGPSLDAWAGLDALTRYPDGPPNALGGVFPDTGSALYAAVGILAALARRDETGAGCHIDLSELELSILLASDSVLRGINGLDTLDGGNSHPRAVWQGAYRCRDAERWLSVSALDEASGLRLCALLGAAPEALGTPEGRAGLEASLRAWCRAREAGEAMRLMQQAGVAAALAHDIPSLVEDPHLKAREFFKFVAHPSMGRQRLYGPIWRLSGMPDDIGRHAPMLGQHSEEVLREWLGMEAREIAGYADARVVY